MSVTLESKHPSSPIIEGLLTEVHMDHVTKEADSNHVTCTPKIESHVTQQKRTHVTTEIHMDHVTSDDYAGHVVQQKRAHVTTEIHVGANIGRSQRGAYFTLVQSNGSFVTLKGDYYAYMYICMYVHVRFYVCMYKDMI